jgi:molecular chaperone IbpA
MRSFDFSPLFRSTVGFDHMSRLLENALNVEEANLAYPPYNIERLDENLYRITMAVAGFAEQDLEIMLENGTLTIKSKAKQDNEKGQYLYRGIAGRAFERRFQLADHIQVTGATLENGLLHVSLERQVPERLKPRTIKIGQPAETRTIDHKAA